MRISIIIVLCIVYLVAADLQHGETEPQVEQKSVVPHHHASIGHHYNISHLGSHAYPQYISARPLSFRPKPSKRPKPGHRRPRPGHRRPRPGHRRPRPGDRRLKPGHRRPRPGHVRPRPEHRRPRPGNRRPRPGHRRPRPGHRRPRPVIKLPKTGDIM